MSDQIEEAGPSNPSLSNPLPSNIFPCFLPDEECEHTIIKFIGFAQRKIIVQAYSFSSLPIAEALIDAKKRGTQVTIFIDKDAEQKKYSLIPKLRKNGIEIEVDQEEGKAHNKVMIIDNVYVITGSYNWTDTQYNHNSDTVIFIKDRCVNQFYELNYEYNQKRTKKMRITESQDNIVNFAKYDAEWPVFDQNGCGLCIVPIHDLLIKSHDDDDFKIFHSKRQQQKEKSEGYLIVSICFPRFENQNCIEFITDNIKEAKKFIYIQAYSFTHKTVSDELIKAHRRNIDIKLLVDQNILNDIGEKISLLYKEGIKVKRNASCDEGLAHDKTIIIDNDIVFSGSFNLTYSAQNRNLENVMRIQNTRFNEMCRNNFMRLWSKSKELDKSVFIQDPTFYIFNTSGRCSTFFE